MSEHDRLEQHPYSVYIEAMQAYVDQRISEQFRRHGWPHPGDFLAICRTLKSVYAGDFQSQYHYDWEHQTIQRRTTDGWETIYPWSTEL
jgi:hypothetical protein